MKITFVNHASFIFEYRHIKLICDPWIEGSVFDNSWSLLVQSNFRYEDFENITHIWFSHEHPDHFFPPNIKKIPIIYRSRIKVLFKHTTDKKVINYCKKLGFSEVIELPANIFYELDKNIFLNCIPWGDDSALMIKTPEIKILNTNDCVIQDYDSANFFLQKTGKPDILFTQFSYASHAGESIDERKLTASMKYEQISLQLEVFQPKYFIPIASFVWFSHEENFRMNDAINKVNDIHNYFSQKYTAIDVIVMSPGSTWDLKNDTCTLDSLKVYKQAYDAIPFSLPQKTITVSLEELKIHAKDFINRLKKLRYYTLLYHLKIIKPLYIELSDFEKKYSLSISEFIEISDNEKCHIKLASQALDFCFKNEYGFNTLSVNARFYVLDNNMLSRLNQFISLGDALNHGRFTNAELFAGAIRRITRKIKKFTSNRLTVGQ